LSVTISAYATTLSTVGTRRVSSPRNATPADRVELAGLLDLVLEGDDVDRPRRGLEVADRLEHDLVAVVVEVLDLDRVEMSQHLVAQDDPAEDAGFSLHVVRQHATVAAHRLHSIRLCRGRSV